MRILRSTNSGCTAEVNEVEYIRDMIEQVLFTYPGERVNQPTFGCGLRGTVFAPISNESDTAAQDLAQGALQQWLGDLIQVEEVTVSSKESTIQVIVKYMIRKTQERKAEEFFFCGLQS